MLGRRGHFREGRRWSCAQPASALPATVARGALSKARSSAAAMPTDCEEPPFDKQARIGRLTCQLSRALASGTGYWTRKTCCGIIALRAAGKTPAGFISDCPALVGELRVAGDDEQLGTMRQRVDSLIRHAVGKIVLVGMPAHIRERRHPRSGTFSTIGLPAPCPRVRHQLSR